jgi:sulfur-oxidizing protein SoxY
MNLHSVSDPGPTGDRRRFLQVLLAGGACVAAVLLAPARLLAAEWNKAAFDARAVDEALKSIGATAIADSADIELKAPEIAENGAIVPVEVVSRIPGTQAVYIVADKNPQPLVAIFGIGDGMEPFVSTRIKMGESSRVRAIVKAGGKYYGTARDVKVTIGGCGG